MSLSIMGSVNTYTKTMKLQTQWNLKQQSGDYTSHKKSLDEWIRRTMCPATKRKYAAASAEPTP